MERKEVKRFGNMKDGEWVKGIDCYLCKSQTPEKETVMILLDLEHLLVKEYKVHVPGEWYVKVCKECYRERKLNDLLNEKNAN
jgi:hypothetical protein